jgi:glutamate/tyrosine decarboxylase-like PLP-dependent enzyme
LHSPHSNIVCLRVRDTKAKGADRLHWDIKEEVNESGYGYVSSTVLNGQRVLRLVIMNPLTTAADVVSVLKRIERIAAAQSQG